MRAPRKARSGRRFVILRALLRQRRRLLLAGVSIALGVGYLAGTLGLLGRIGSGLDQLASVSADDAQVVIEGEVAYESPLEKVRRMIPADLAEYVASIDGVESVSHRVEGTALVLGDSDQPVAALGLSEQPLLTNWPDDPEVSNLEIIGGRAPEASGEVMLDSHTAQGAGVGVGDRVRVSGRADFDDYEVVGIADSANTGRSDGSSLVVMSTEDARLVLDQPFDDNRIAIRTTAGADVDSVIEEISGIVGSGIEVTDGATAAAHAQESMTRSFTLIRVLVTGFGVLALLVGMVTVANSLTLLHSQRRRTFAGFRLVGASRRQLRRAAFGEAMILATVSSVVGLPLGLLLALLIERALGTMGTAVPTAGPPLSVQAAAASVGLGLAATLVAAWRPVRNACSVPPIEAVSEVDPLKRRRWPLAAVAASRAVVLAVAAAAVCVVAGTAVSTTLVAVGVTLVAVFVASLLPAGLTWAVSEVMRILPIRPRPLRLVASRDARRNPRRTAATTAAVLLVAAVVTALAVFLQSFTASLDGAVDELVTADLVVDSGTFARGGLPADLVEQLRFVDGVDAASGWQLGRGYVDGAPVRMTGLDGDAVPELLSPQIVEGSTDELGPGSAWISAPLAASSGLKVGDIVPLEFTSGGYEQLVLTGVYRGSSGIFGDVVTDREVLMRQVPATQDLAAIVATDGSAATLDRVEELSASYGVTAVTDPDQFIGDRGDVLRGFERVVLWMLLFTLLQALVGVINTLVLSVGERRREFALLRVAGTSRRSLLRMVLLEGVSFSSVGTLLGIVAGTAAAAAAVFALGSLGLGVFSIPVLTVVGVAAVAVFAGVAASWIPARMAARVPPMEALVDTGAEFARTAAVPEPVPSIATVPAGRPAPIPVVATAQVPPPFDPTRLPAPVLLTDVGALDAQQILSVAVLDGSSVTALATDSAEALALLELYGLVAPVQPGAPEHAVVPEPAAVPEHAVVPEEAGVPEPVAASADPAAEAIAMLLSEALYPSEPAVGADEAPVAAEGPVESAPFEPAAMEQFEQPVTPFAPETGPEREKRSGLRRSRRKDPADRRPPRRVRRGPVPAAAEGWVVAGDPADAKPDLSEPVRSEPIGAATGGLVPEPRDLAAAVRRLDAHTQARWSAVLHSMNTALANGEEVDALVCGRVHAAPAAVTRTDRRLLVVAERPGRMAIESLHPSATGVVVRPGPAGTVVVVLIDRGRPLEVTDVTDTAAAEALVLRQALHP